MRKLSLVAAIVLLSSAWVLAQSGTSPSDQNPSSTSPSQTSPSSTSPSSQQPAQQPDTSSQSSSASASTVEGCVGGSAGNFTLTDASGKTYQLSGDTSKLADHVGHQVRITGDEGAGASGAASGASSGAAGGSNTINVKKVKMISSSCPTSK